MDDRPVRPAYHIQFTGQTTYQWRCGYGPATSYRLVTKPPMRRVIDVPCPADSVLNFNSCSVRKSSFSELHPLVNMKYVCIHKIQLNERVAHVHLVSITSSVFHQISRT